MRFDSNDQLSPEFVALNPNNKIPAILDPNGPGGKPLPLFESGAILLYLAEKAQRFLPQDAAGRYETIQWLMFQMGGVGPMLGQVDFLQQVRRGRSSRTSARATGTSGRRNGCSVYSDRHLTGRTWMMGETYTIAEHRHFPGRVNVLNTFYGAGDLVGMKDFREVNRVLEVFLARPAVVRGLNIPPRP